MLSRQSTTFGYISDSDEQRFTVPLLRSWKTQAEEFARSRVEKPHSQESRQDKFNEPLVRILEDSVRQRLNDTVYRLERIALSPEFDHIPGVVVQSQLFETYTLDNDQPTTSSTYIASFDEAFELHKRRVLLMGKAGAGKSTALVLFAERQIQERLRNPAAKLPIYVPIARWPGSKPLIQWILQQSSLPQAAIDEIRDGRALLLLDGLDEIASSYPEDSSYPEGVRDLQVEFLECFEEELFGNAVVITCRERDYENLRQRSGREI